MDHGLGTGSFDKSKVLEVKPLRILAPIFPNKPGASPSYVSVPLSGSHPGVQPFYPFMVPNETQNNTQRAAREPDTVDFDINGIAAPVPLNSYRAPTPKVKKSVGRPRKNPVSKPVVVDDDADYTANGNKGGSVPRGRGRPRKNPAGSASKPVVVEDDDEYAENQSDEEGGSVSRGRPKRRMSESSVVFDVDGLVDSFLTSFKLNEFDDFKSTNGDKDTVGSILLVYNLLRRKLTQLEEAKALPPGTARRPDLKSATLLTAKGVRTNSVKRVGHVPGIEVGDIFFFRMELCIVGLHFPTMAGIDYMGVKVTVDEEPIAVSIISSGGYDDDVDDSDVLIYSGQGGGGQRKDGQVSDQKLERGNLALEKSLHRGNEVRVIRGIKDTSNPTSTGKIYVYDGLYKIQESWAEKNKTGCMVFKYKLIRVPGQPAAFSIWKSIQQWRDVADTRRGVILPDLTSGAETLPVTLVNDMDDEKGPAHFMYIPTLKYSKPFATPRSNSGCQCLGGCQPGDTGCTCNLRNGGHVPYSSIGVLMSTNSPIHECGPTCSCPPSCRNRMSQAGVRVRLEVFKTKTKGWGLRSWDPIRAGSFICEYAGDVIKGDFGNDSDDNYIFDATRYYEPLEAIREDSIDSTKAPFPLVISAKENGNVGRFMNHSCSSNVYWLPVLRESNDEAYLHVAFFAIHHIPPMQELTYDYGMVQSENREIGKRKCLCESVKCRGYFY